MKKREEKNNDIKINPKIVDDELLFYFTNKAIEFFKFDTASNAYRFSGHLINSLLEKYKDHPGKIGLVGENIQTIKISMAMILQGYDEYIQTVFLRDIIPYHKNCQPKSPLLEIRHWKEIHWKPSKWGFALLPSKLHVPGRDIIGSADKITFAKHIPQPRAKK